MKRLLLFIISVMGAIFVQAQALTWTPPFPKEDDPSQTLAITLDAAKGNQGLLNYTPTSDVYVHIGVITSKSTSSADWKYVKFTWATTPAAANAVYKGSNKWTYTIAGSLRSFFGITDATETIQQIALLFRSGNGNLVQRNADASDMYVPIYGGNSLAVRLSQPPREPKFTPTPETQTWTVGSTINLAADASKPSTIKLYHNGTLIATSVANATTVAGTSTIATAGNQKIVAEATDGTNTTKDSVEIFVAPQTPVASLPAGVRDGINYGSNNTSVTLVLRAPGKSVVTAIGDFNNWTQSTQYVMNKTPDGRFFWITLTGLTAGTEYAFQYVVDGTLKIADPYSEKILDPSNDAFISATTYPGLKAYPTGKTTGIVGVLQPGQMAYNWSVANFNRPDKRGLVIYELLVRDFVAAHDWKTVQDSLGYLQKLGINAIEIMPLNEFEGNSSWGYNPDFYFTPDKYYGPANNLKQFVDSCHRRGIAVIMDIALNHQFGSSPMVQLYYDGTANRPAADNPWFNQAAKHAFNVGFDMNHESADTKYFVGRVTEYWLQQFKIDGFRFDLSKGFTQKQTCDATGGNCNVSAWSAYDASRVAIWKGYYDTVQAKSANAYAILEHFADNTEEKELSDYGMMLWGNLNYNYGQASKGVSTDWDFSGGIYSVRGWTVPHLVTYAESHDEERIMYKDLNEGATGVNYNIKDTTTALKRSELTAAFLFTIPGPKMIWQFGELGYHYSINTCTNGTISNDCRLAEKPIRWDFLADTRRKNLYNTYSKLINLRFHPWYTAAFQNGTVDRNLSGSIKWIKLTTANDTSDLVVVGNFDVTTQTDVVTFPVAGTWYDFFNNTTFTSTGAPQPFTLQPGEYRVFVNRNVNNIITTPVSNVPWNGSSLLASAFPNPIRGAYTIKLFLPQSGTTTIALYNSTGQYVKTLYTGFLLKGERSLPLQRPSVTTGTYFIKVQTKGESKTIPITLQ